jgi:hypothetical protein
MFLSLCSVSLALYAPDPLIGAINDRIFPCTPAIKDGLPMDYWLTRPPEAEGMVDRGGETTEEGGFWSSVMRTRVIWKAHLL